MEKTTIDPKLRNGSVTVTMTKGSKGQLSCTLKQVKLKDVPTQTGWPLTSARETFDHFCSSRFHITVTFRETRLQIELMAGPVLKNTPSDVKYKPCYSVEPSFSSAFCDPWLSFWTA